MEDLQHDSLVDGELGYDVSQQQVTVVLGCRVNALLGQEARPGEGHEATQLGSLPLVVGVVDVRGSVLHQETGELQQEDAHRVLQQEA